MAGARGRTTLLVATREWIARGDVPKGGGEMSVEWGPRTEEGEGLGALVDAAARLAPEPVGAAVWVLAEEVYCQTLTLPGRAIQGLGREEVGRALEYEARVLSGIGSSESVLGWREQRVDGPDRGFWIAQLPARDREEIDATVRALGGRLAGVLHPAGLPTRLAPGGGDGSPWTRREIWNDAVAVVEGRPDGTRVAWHRRGEAPPRSGAGDAEETLQAVRTAVPAVPAPGSGATLRLDDRETLALWLSAWHRVLAAGAASVPVLPSPVRPPSPAARAAGLLGGVLVVAALCGAHRAWMQSESREFRREAAGLQEPVARLAEAKRRADLLEKDAAALRETAAAAAREKAARDALLRVPVIQLKALSEACPPGVVVESILLDVNRTVVRGRCVLPELADRLAAGLSAALGAGGFRVGAPVRRVEKSTGRAALYSFDLEVFPPAPPPSAAKAIPGRDW